MITHWRKVCILCTAYWLKCKIRSEFESSKSFTSTYQESSLAYLHFMETIYIKHKGIALPSRAPVPTIPPMFWLSVIYQKMPWQILNSNFLWSTSLLSLVFISSLKRQRLALPNAKNHNGCFHHFSLLLVFFFPFKSPTGSKVFHKLSMLSKAGAPLEIKRI